MRLEPDVRTKLNERAKSLGLDAAAYVRMLVYRDANGDAADGQRFHLGTVDRSNDGRRPRLAADHARPGALAPAPERELDEPELEDLVDDNEPRAEDMEIPADPDSGAPGLDDVMAGASDILDQMVALSAQPAAPARQAQRPRPPQRGYQPRFGNRNQRQAMPAYGPGSATRIVGINDQVAGQNQYGDGHGNVLRDNMRHLGLVGTRSRA